MLALIAGVLAYSSVLIRFDNLHYDLGRYFTFKPAPADIVIVAIDETSLTSIGRWPWSRIVHADLVNKLKQAQSKVIGLDIIFSEPELNHPEADIALARAIKQAGNVVLPELLEVPFAGAPIKLSMPMTSFAEHAAALGSVHVPLEVDGIARGLYLWEGLGNARMPHFSQTVLQAAKQLPDSMSLFSPNILATNKTALVALEARKVKFLGPPGHFKRISYINVLTGDYPAHFFKNKIVLVGATAAGMGDALPTPVSASSQPMPGVEYHANAIATMRNSELIINAPLWLNCLLNIILAVIPLLFLPNLSPLKSLLAIILYYFVITVFAVALPNFFNVWIPLSGALIATLLAYPIWSWRKLESAQSFLDVALQNLEAELSLLGADNVIPEYVDDQDAMQSRISKVKLTSQYLRDFQQNRRDTLSFISHDIRAPLGAAIMLLNDEDSNKHLPRIARMLNKSLGMADDFLQSSRAEMADVAKFQDLDLVSLLQQAVDDVYAAARVRSIKFEISLVEAGLWLKGDSGLLQRAISNVLLNALKYSPENSTVKITLAEFSNEAVLKITDAGLGIAPEKIARLFKRFSRVEGVHQAPEGSGLGLYFVDVTIRKHQGSVSVESELGQGTTFIITLPIEQI